MSDRSFYQTVIQKDLDTPETLKKIKQQGPVAGFVYIDSSRTQSDGGYQLKYYIHPELLPFFANGKNIRIKQDDSVRHYIKLLNRRRREKSNKNNVGTDGGC